MRLQLFALRVFEGPEHARQHAKENKLRIFTSKSALSESLDEVRKQKKSIGFVPTMGALHDGHLSLIRNAQQQSDVVVCSIFVNPTQFEDQGDLERYPRPVEADVEKLNAVNCDILFMPSVAEMYQAGEAWHIELGYLETILEGRYRPGHYQGVTQIVKKLFDVVNPDKAFFGQKDFQQVMVLRKMVEILNLPVKLVMCPIKREADGLALSSRNIHLSREEHQLALSLSSALSYVKDNFEYKDLESLKKEAEALLLRPAEVELDYFVICDAETLLPAPSKEVQNIIALVAARVGKTRLIDNMMIKETRV